jgi:hypothetical protein
MNRVIDLFARGTCNRTYLLVAGRVKHRKVLSSALTPLSGNEKLASMSSASANKRSYSFRSGRFLETIQCASFHL